MFSQKKITTMTIVLTSNHFSRGTKSDLYSPMRLSQLLPTFISKDKKGHFLELRLIVIIRLREVT
jgi:hypothetical protein